MRKVILGVAVSLDGFIEGPHGEYDWCPPPSGSEMKAFMDGIDTIFFGRRSFELVGPSAFPGKACYVFSTTLKPDSKKRFEVISKDVVNRIRAIKSSSGKNIWLFGGASLTTTFMNEGLVDELWLGMVPIVLGKGKPLFQNIEQRKHFVIQNVQQKSGYISMKLKYEPTVNKK